MTMTLHPGECTAYFTARVALYYDCNVFIVWFPWQSNIACLETAVTTSYFAVALNVCRAAFLGSGLNILYRNPSTAKTVAVNTNNDTLTAQLFNLPDFDSGCTYPGERWAPCQCKYLKLEQKNKNKINAACSNLQCIVLLLLDVLLWDVKL